MEDGELVDVALTVKVTGTEVCDVPPLSPARVTRIDAWYVPAANPEILALTMTWSVSVEIVPDAGEIVSQEALSVAFQFLVTPRFL
jgi:hypothetical protein